MSTRSMIFIKNDDESFTGIYCHFDGYLSYVGKQLFENYNDQKSVEDLIALGDISSLSDTVDLTSLESYVRRGEKFHQTKFKTLEALEKKVRKDIWIEYCYLFIDGVWHYFSYSNPIKKLTEEAIEAD